MTPEERDRAERAAKAPRAPTQARWDAMTPAERAAVDAALPGEVTYDEMAMPEGDRHFKAKVRALQALRGYFTRQRRKAYLTAELPVYYPDEPRFAPDLLAVLEVEDHEREKWFVSAEGRGLDFVLEVHVGGDRMKEAVRNVERYARLGIPEYFIYDRARQRLLGYHLPSAQSRSYAPLIPQHGRFVSEVLGLELQLENDRLRFWAGSASLLDAEELIGRLEELTEGLQQRAEEEARRAEEEARRAEEEARRAEEETRRRVEAERRVAELEAELERLRRSR